MTQTNLLRAILELLQNATDADGIECVASGEVPVTVQLGQAVIESPDSFAAQIYAGHDEPSLALCQPWVKSVLAVPLAGPYGDGGWIVIGCSLPDRFADSERQALDVAAQAVEGLLDLQVEHARLNEASSELLTSQEALRQGSTQLLETNRELSMRATTDSLTGLVNREEIERLFAWYESAGTALADPDNPPPSQCAIALIDLDGFKTVNDEHGHVAGDALLRIVGRRLLSQVRGHDMAGRWGGDEFIIVLAGPVSEEAARDRIAAIRDVLRMPYNIRGNKITIDASVGTALWSAGQVPLDVVAEADAAMYHEKRTSAARS